MNDTNVDALRLACHYVEEFRLVALADVARSGGSLPQATAAIRTSTSFGGSSEAGAVDADASGLKVRVGGYSQPEVAVSWTAVATALTPVLRGDLSVELVAAYKALTAAQRSDSPSAWKAARQRWSTAKTAVLDAAFATLAVQPSLFPAPDATPSLRPTGRGDRGR